jgi:hypothetical protein
VLVKHKIPKVRMSRVRPATAPIRTVIGAIAGSSPALLDGHGARVRLSDPKRCSWPRHQLERRQQVLGVELDSRGSHYKR